VPARAGRLSNQFIRIAADEQGGKSILARRRKKSARNLSQIGFAARIRPPGAAQWQRLLPRAGERDRSMPPTLTRRTSWQTI
jgi:hypothetical protein